MFAIIAMICFLLALIGVSFGPSMVVLGLLFIALHLVFNFRPWGRGN